MFNSPGINVLVCKSSHSAAILTTHSCRESQSLSGKNCIKGLVTLSQSKVQKNLFKRNVSQQQLLLWINPEGQHDWFDVSQASCCQADDWLLEERCRTCHAIVIPTITDIFIQNALSALSPSYNASDGTHVYKQQINRWSLKLMRTTLVPGVIFQKTFKNPQQ